MASDEQAAAVVKHHTDALVALEIRAILGVLV